MIDPNDLREADTDVSGSLQKKAQTTVYQKALDVVKKMANGMEFVILGLENQDKIHYAMPLRIMQGDVMLYMKEFEEIKKENREQKTYSSKDEFLSGFNADDRLHPVITLCVYYGEDEWDGPRCLMDMLNIPEKMKNMVSDYKMNLLEIRKSGSMVFNNQDVKNVFDLVRRIYNEEFSKINELYDNIDLNPEVGIAVGSITNNQKLVRHALSIKEKGGQFNMCSALEKLEEQNYERGIQDGIQKGKKEGIQEGIQKGKQEGIQEGMKKATALFGQIVTESAKKNVSVDYGRLSNLDYLADICNILDIPM